MSCKDLEQALSELADGTLAGEARARAEAHLEGCAGCRATLADIRRIRQEARRLPKVQPPAELWAKVRARVEAEAAAPAKVVGIESRPRARSFSAWLPARRPAWSLLATAALLVAGVATAIVLLLQTISPAPARQTAAGAPAAPQTASANAAAADLVQTVEMELQQADRHYEKAIAGLEQVAREGQGTLDERTTAVLQKNLGVIDQAIRESRSALQAQPTSEMARVSLFEALRRKVDLLQETVTLINEMRKGNQAAAAEIVGNVRQ